MYNSDLIELYYLEASEPKWVKPDDIQYGVNSLRFGVLHLITCKSKQSITCCITTELF